MTTSCAQEFRLLPLTPGAAGEFLEIPPGPSPLHFPAGEDDLPELSAGMPAVKPEADPGQPAWLAEPIFRGAHPRLLLLRLGILRFVVNGVFSEPVAALSEKDRVRFEGVGATSYVVALYHRPLIGRPPPELVGKPCPLCLLPFSPDTEVYQCACGLAVHLESSGGGPEPLQCARSLSECPSCRQPLRLQAGYSFPEEEYYA